MMSRRNVSFLFAGVVLFVALLNQVATSFRKITIQASPVSKVLLSFGTPSHRLSLATHGKFLVVTTQRSGSGFFITLLNNHTHIACGHEMLRHFGPDYAGTPIIDEYMQSVEQQWNTLNSTASSPSSVGFKVMYNQGVAHHREDLLKRLSDMDVKVIHLVRRNKLLQYISFQANIMDSVDDGKNGHLAHPKTEEAVARLQNYKVDPNPEIVLQYIIDKTTDDVTFAQLLSSIHGLEATSVYYEDLVNNTDLEMTRVFTFLGEETERVSSTFLKIHKDSRSRDFFEEKGRHQLQAALQERSDFASMLDGW